MSLVAQTRLPLTSVLPCRLARQILRGDEPSSAQPTSMIGLCQEGKSSPDALGRIAGINSFWFFAASVGLSFDLSIFLVRRTETLVTIGPTGSRFFRPRNRRLRPSPLNAPYHRRAPRAFLRASKIL